MRLHGVIIVHVFDKVNSRFWKKLKLIQYIGGIIEKRAGATQPIVNIELCSSDELTFRD
jgi:hypothetical protein